jgi:hypothetical protein
VKLKNVLAEVDGTTNQYASKWTPGYASSWGIKGYRTTPGNKLDDPVSQTLDPYIEEQLIDQVIDVMYRDYPEMVKDKKVKKHLIQMLVGKVMSGEVRDIIDIDRFIKRLKKRMKVETL